MRIFFFFFFSSRRRHTRFDCDWSSDVCSSDLYQVEAAAKFVGGMDYTFAVRGDGETPTKIVSPGEQRRALAAVLATLRPSALALPESLLRMIPPRPPDYQRGREHFKIHTSPT